MLRQWDKRDRRVFWTLVWALWLIGAIQLVRPHHAPHVVPVPYPDPSSIGSPLPAPAGSFSYSRSMSIFAKR